jgi:DNA-directed RNA polymerase subunit RPC12/RpoP
MSQEDVTVAECGECGREMELWPDELARRCPQCGQRVINPGLDLKCLEWCQNAEECLRQIRGATDSLQEAIEYAREHMGHEQESEEADSTSNW